MIGATYALTGEYDAGLYHVQRELVRLGFLASATGRWDWDTYAAIGFATQYIGVPWHDVVHARTNTIDINDDWVNGLERAHPAPAGTIGLWSSMPHRAPVWPWLLVGGVAAAGAGFWYWRRKCRR